MNIFYQSFLLRMWKTDNSDCSTWHASLENPHTHEVMTFHNPDALYRFLMKITETPECGDLSHTESNEGRDKNEKH